MGEWIEHDGRGNPYRAGQMVETVDRCGFTDRFKTIGAAVCDAAPEESCWHWAVAGEYGPMDILRHRVVSDPQSEADAALSRQATLRDIAERAGGSGPEIERDRFRKAFPAKKREGV